MSKWTKEFVKEYDRKRYQANKDLRFKQVANRRKEYRKMISEIKSKSKCSKCPENHPACLTFHHINDNKEFNIGDAIRLGYGKENILKEISKCEILCSNCHMKLHFDEL